MVRAERRQSRPHDVLGRLLQRPNFWRRDHPLPIILVAGPQASKTVQWLSEPFKESLPFAAPENDNSPELGELVDQIAGEHGLLGTPVSASFLPAPRFPLAQFVLWSLAQRDIKPEGVAESETWPTDLRDRKSQEVFKARLRSRRYARLRGEPGGWPTWLDFLARAFIVWIPGGTLAALGAGLIKNIVSLGPGFIGLIIGLAVGVIGLLFQTFFSITGSIFSRWFARQPYLRRKPFERLWRYGLRIACTANTTTTSANDVVDRLLVHAMLADLRQAYKKWWFPWPSWGRGRYSLLVLSAEPKSVHRHFLDVMTHVIEETGKFAPLVVLVSASSVDDTETRPIAGGKVQEFDKVADQWRGASKRRVPSLRLKLEITDNFSSDSSTDRQSATTLRAFMYWIATFCLAASVLIAYYVFSTTHGCGDGLKSEHAQCVGLTSDLDRMKPDPLVRPALTKILAENAAIPNWAPTVTVFYLGPLTKDPQAKSGDELNGSLGELTGLQARQHEYNEQSSDWRIKIEFANTGQDFRSAAFAAEKIRQRAQRDKRVAAVIGLAWSRKETQDAIRIIGRAQLPMLSTNNTADITPRVNGNDASPYFFRMAAPDSAQAEAMRWWLSRGLVRGGSAVPSERVAILEQQDTNDFYSADLAQAVRNELRGVPRLLRFSSRTDLQSRVREACEEGAQVLVYTGRTVYLDTLLDEKVKICQGPSVRILAGDDVSDAVAKAGAKRQWAYQTTMDFVALTNPQSEPGPNPALRNLPKEGAPTDARLAYDALLAVGYSLDELIDQQAPNATKADLNIAAGVLYNLRGLHSESPINGTSGQFSFTEERTDHTAVPRELWLNSVDWSNGVRSIAKCEFNSKRVTCH